jgi:hypothetical protein
LCLQGDLAGVETQIHKDQAKNSLVHTPPCGGSGNWNENSARQESVGRKPFTPPRR